MMYYNTFLQMNLFTKEALTILHQLEVPDKLAMERLYRPVIAFHRNHALTLKEWLNEVAYGQLVKQWWSAIVQVCLIEWSVLEHMSFIEWSNRSGQ